MAHSRPTAAVNVLYHPHPAACPHCCRVGHKGGRLAPLPLPARNQNTATLLRGVMHLAAQRVAALSVVAALGVWAQCAGLPRRRLKFKELLSSVVRAMVL